MRIFSLLIVLVFLRPGAQLSATQILQSDSLKFAEFSSALGKIFSDEKIQSILSKLPPNCNIFGYDVGDFSGDDGMDVVLSTRLDDARDRTIDVHFFVNAGSAFHHAQTLQRRFVLEPIEVGFTIERGAAFVTEKTAEFGWRITGYAVRDGIFRRVSQWTTDRMRYRGRQTAVGFERSYDLQNNMAEEHYFGTNSNRSFLRQTFYDLPLFRENDDIPAAITRQIGDSTALMVVRGGSSWHGPEDCSILCSGVYDSSSVELHLTIRDDRLLYEGVLDSSDYAALSFDFSRKTRVRPGGAAQQWSPNTRLDILLVMGDGERRTPVVELRGSKLSSAHGHEVRVSMREDSTQFHLYHFTVRLPRSLFESDGKPVPAGFVCWYHDVDYPANLSWVSMAATSRAFESDAPETWGRLHFVRDARERYEWENLHLRAMTRHLRRAGVLP